MGARRKEAEGEGRWEGREGRARDELVTGWRENEGGGRRGRGHIPG